MGKVCTKSLFADTGCRVFEKLAPKTFTLVFRPLFLTALSIEVGSHIQESIGAQERKQCASREGNDM